MKANSVDLQRLHLHYLVRSKETCLRENGLEDGTLFWQSKGIKLSSNCFFTLVKGLSEILKTDMNRGVPEDDRELSDWRNALDMYPVKEGRSFFDGVCIEVSGSPTEKAVIQWGTKIGLKFDVRLQATLLQHVCLFNSSKKRGAVALRGLWEINWKAVSTYTEKKGSCNFKTTLECLSSNLGGLIVQIKLLHLSADKVHLDFGQTTSLAIFTES
ncbi:hypothetical protein OSB04_026520 [Centaurea solstitialis]|uniref:Uncharacterized protein n=1 Tax=Centaurea solstitialis TaxID=347529 RepID=A0AA38SBM1_9ASTR|nr:hypothetical protein OSB04_026520 [Centaurea solstitialis]